MLEHGRQALGAVLLQARHALDGRQQGGHAVVAAQEIGGAHRGRALERDVGGVETHAANLITGPQNRHHRLKSVDFVTLW
jgi:hypothetical protein